MTTQHPAKFRSHSETVSGLVRHGNCLELRTKLVPSPAPFQCLVPRRFPLQFPGLARYRSAILLQRTIGTLLDANGSPQLALTPLPQCNIRFLTIVTECNKVEYPVGSCRRPGSLFGHFSRGIYGFTLPLAL